VTENVELNEAHGELFQLAVYGHHTYWPEGSDASRYIAEVHDATDRLVDAVRADERVRVLREVRNAAAAADRRCSALPGTRKGDPWLWGYGASKVVAFLSWKLGEARRAAGLEPPRKPMN
jgi:hypothetical protein